VALDSGSADAVGAFLAARDEAGKPPIRGLIHAAGVTEGQLLTELEVDRLRTTMWPKISGSRVLHEAFPPGSVEFFYLTSAAGAVFGVPGQGAYASANAYLDGLARARHRQGCRALSLNWVAWRGLGFATEARWCSTNSSGWARGRSSAGGVPGLGASTPSTWRRRSWCRSPVGSPPTRSR
jgi:phthiocerol/phenolphthiocerol synthesis type-I polyketide synthase A